MQTRRSASIGLADDSEWLTIAQAAERLGVSTRTIQRRIHAGKLEAQRIHKRRVQVRVMKQAPSQQASPVQSELFEIQVKLDRLIRLVETAIRLYAPQTIEEVARKWG